eukprot:2669757-Karenia_brevis.AAC.1
MLRHCWIRCAAGACRPTQSASAQPSQLARRVGSGSVWRPCSLDAQEGPVAQGDQPQRSHFSL